MAGQGSDRGQPRHVRPGPRLGASAWRDRGMRDLRQSRGLLHPRPMSVAFAKRVARSWDEPRTSNLEMPAWMGCASLVWFLFVLVSDAIATRMMNIPRSATDAPLALAGLVIALPATILILRAG